jgi:hypothetical protein
MDWRVTSTTLFCNTLKKWVCILVYKDGKTHCGYFHRRTGSGHEQSRKLSCEGPAGCALCEAYKEDVFRRDRMRSQ